MGRICRIQKKRNKKGTKEITNRKRKTLTLLVWTIFRLTFNNRKSDRGKKMIVSAYNYMHTYAK